MNLRISTVPGAGDICLSFAAFIVDHRRMTCRIRPALPLLLAAAVSGEWALLPDATAQTRQAEATRAPALSGWATTVTFQRATRRAASGIVTGSLPPTGSPRSLGGKGIVHDLEGIASYYWQSQRTASGETFDKMAMTAAHRSLPFGTRVRVTNIANRRTVIVRINDRGPFKPGRVIDLSLAAAGEIGMQAQGLARVVVEVLD
jgi:rare lipoprotein A